MNSEELLAMERRKAEQQSKGNKSSDDNDDDDEQNDERYSTMRRRSLASIRYDPNHPTLIGSARTNLHLLNDQTNLTQHNTTIQPGAPGNAAVNNAQQANRTHLGLSILGEQLVFLFVRV